MNRAPNLQGIDSSKAGDTPEKEGPAYDYKEIAREVLARIDQRLADLEPGAPPRSSGERPSEPGSDSEVETIDDGISPGDQTALVRLALRGLVGLLLSASLVAAIAFLWSHHDGAKQMLAEWPPQAILGSTRPEEKPQPSLPAAAKAVADAVPAQAAPEQSPAALPTQPRTTPDNDKPTAVPLTAELAALMRKIDRDIAGLAQAVNELRLAQQQAGQQASQASQQASDDTARATDEIKQGVNQLARSIVRAEQEEQAARPKPPAPQTRAAVAPSRAAAPAPRNRRYAPMYYSPRDAEAQLLR
jgi:hypothetical protein